MKLKQYSRAILLCTVCALSFATPSNVAHSQEDAQGEDATARLKTVTVTARKREESLQETPVVITALTKEMVEDFAIDSMDDIADFTPGLITSSSNGTAAGRIFMRGIGSGAQSPAIDQAISLVVDDMQLGSFQFRNSALIDMESVQIYKGPQALFFGKNSPGGVLSIQTANPGAEFEAELTSSYEFEAREWSLQGMVSGPLSDNVGGRLVVRRAESDGFFDVESGSFEDSTGGKAPGYESTFARGTLVLDPTESLDINAKLTYSKLDGDVGQGATFQRYYCPLGAPQNSEPFNCEADGTLQLTDIPQEAIDNFATVGINIGPSGVHDNEQWLATVGVDYNVTESLRFSSVTGYYDAYDAQSYSPVFGLSAPFVLPAPVFDFSQFTQEFRLGSDFDAPVNFVAGVFYEDKEINVYSPVSLNIAPSVWIVPARTEFDQKSTAASVFADFFWNVTDRLEISGGARYSEEEKQFIGVAGYVGDEENDWSNVSPQVTISWHPNDEWMLFGSYREGFKSGGFDGAFKFSVTEPFSYEPESVEGFEFGAKGTLFDNSLQLNAAIYQYDYDDLQLSRFDSSTLSSNTFNAASAEISGIELDFVWLTPIEGLTSRGYYAFNDAEFTDFIGDCYGGQTIAEGCNLNPVGGAFTAQNLTGQRLNYAPENVANFGVAYDRSLGTVDLGLSVDALYSDSFEVDPTFAPGTEMDSYSKFNASVRISDPDEKWYAALIGRNLTDEYVVYSASLAPSAPASGTGTTMGLRGDSIGTVGIGRTVTIELGVKF